MKIVHVVDLGSLIPGSMANKSDWLDCTFVLVVNRLWLDYILAMLAYTMSYLENISMVCTAKGWSASMMVLSATFPMGCTMFQSHLMNTQD